MTAIWWNTACVSPPGGTIVPTTHAKLAETTTAKLRPTALIIGRQAVAKVLPYFLLDR
jgi:hypothetical protein